jgi:phosphatidate cytidylyltransferase
MLRQRVFTAIILLAPLLAALFYLPPLAVAALFGIVVALAAWEWAGLCGFASAAQRTGLALFLLALGTIGTAILHARPTLIWSVALFAAAWWAWVFVELIRHDARPVGLFVSPASKIIGAVMILVPPWFAAYYLHAHDSDRPSLLLFVLVLVGAADSFAYLVGHLFGRTKLAPQLSPGKTVEGLLGGLASVIVLAALWGLWLRDMGGWHLAAWLGLAVTTMLFSVVGDLAESRLKRLAGVKDSGSILPGHGGVLDRIDAFTAAAPIFLLGWIVLFQAPAQLP